MVAWKAIVDHGAVIDDMTALQRLAIRRNVKVTLNVWIERSAPYRCPECGCTGVSVCEGCERIVRGLPFGNIPTVIHVTSHRMCSSPTARGVKPTEATLSDVLVTDSCL